MKRCQSCGDPVGRISRSYCDTCLAELRSQDQLGNLAKGRSRLKDMRRVGTDPAHGGPARVKRAASRRRATEAAAVWEAVNEVPDPDVFIHEILPWLSKVPLPRMAVATGLSIPYCGQIRKGKVTPHARHWETLRRVGTQPLGR
jgi:hypothetical protein